MGILRWIILSLRHNRHAWERESGPSVQPAYGSAGERRRERTHTNGAGRPTGGMRDAAVVIAGIVAAYALIGVMVALMAVL